MLIRRRYGEFVLKQHQHDILPVLDNADHYLLVWAMRMGKSLPALIAALKVPGNVLIVCPVKAIAGWKETISKGNFPEERVTVISQDSLHQLGRQKFSSIIIDEIHCYRAYSSRFKLLRTYTQAAHKVIGLTGTPLDKAGLEFFYPMQLLDNGERFGTRKQAFLDFWGYQVDKYNYALREDKRGAFTNLIMRNADVQESNYLSPQVQKVYFGLTPEQEKCMTQLRKGDLPDWIKNREAVYNKAIIYNKILQLEGGFFIEDNITHDHIETTKWDTFRTLIESLRGKRIIIWVNYIYEKKLVKDILAEMGFKAKLYKEKTRQEFQNGHLDAIIAHTKSASAGVDLSQGEVMVFTTPTDSGINYQQSAARFCVEGGLDRKTIYFVIGKGGRSGEVMNLLSSKATVQELFYMGEIA